MSDSEQPISSGAEPAGDTPAARLGTRRRGRRGGRGRRKTFAPRPGEDTPAAETQDASAPAPVESAAAAAPAATGTTEPQPARTERPEQRPVFRPERPARESQSESEPLPPRRPPIAVRPLVERVQRLTERVARVEPEHRVSAIHQAIDEVMAVVEILKRSVDQMEEVLELVEVAERQKLADEREIENLRRALRQFHDLTPDRPREQRGGGSRDPRGSRDQRDQRDTRAPRAPRPPESRDQRERRESQEPPAPRGAKDFREPHPEPEPSAPAEISRSEDEPQQGS